MAPTHISNLGPYRYAVAERFAPSQYLSYLDPAPETICPQLPTSFPAFQAILGPIPGNPLQSEDCLQLRVFTPKRTGKKLPVMVYIHGGSYMYLGGVLSWFDGTRLAREGVVVVTINYRLGPLGFLYMPERNITPTGIGDQVQALKWVQEHIGDFDGDKDKVTIFGQSAGALSVNCLYRTPEAKGLFHAGIMESAPLELTAHNLSWAEECGRKFESFLNEDIYTANLSALLQASSNTTDWTVEAYGGDGLQVPWFPLNANGPITVHGLPLVNGWNKDDMRALGANMSEAAAATLAEYVNSTLANDAEMHDAHNPTATYVFKYEPKGSVWGATHNLEVPFILGTEAAWNQSKMLGNETWWDFDRVGRPLRKAWAEFGKTASIQKMKSVKQEYLNWLD